MTVLRKMRMIWATEHARTDRPCAACGRPLTGREFAVHVIDGGLNVLHPNDAGQYVSDGGEMGLHVVGPECRKKFGEFAQPY